eukprot:5846082-Amphidinium_carterae.1
MNIYLFVYFVSYCFGLAEGTASCPGSGGGAPGEPLPQAPHVEGPHRRVVTFNTFARCLDCHRQTDKVRGKFNFPYLRRQECRPREFNFPYLRRQECRPLNKTFARRTDPPAAGWHPEVEPQDWQPAAEPLVRQAAEDPQGIG